MVFLQRQNNRVEAWHRRIQAHIVVDHPALFTCLHKIGQEQRHTEVENIRLETGFRKKRQRRSMTEQHLRLITLTTDFESGRKNVATFLQGVAHAFSRTDPFGEIMDADHPDMDALEDKLQEGLGEVLAWVKFRMKATLDGKCYHDTCRRNCAENFKRQRHTNQSCSA